MLDVLPVKRVTRPGIAASLVCKADLPKFFSNSVKDHDAVREHDRAIQRTLTGAGKTESLLGRSC